MHGAVVAGLGAAFGLPVNQATDRAAAREALQKMITSRPLTALLATTIAAVVFASAAGSARAQSACNLPESTVAARTPTDVDAAAVKACVDGNAPGLKGDYDAIRAARQAILTPLRGQNVSVFFRLAYSDSLRPVITPLVKNPSDDIAINAIRIAGEIGTTDGAQLCVLALDDPRAGVRMMGASGLARTFSVLWTTPTIQPVPFAQIEGRLAAALGREKDPEVLDGFAMAYESAMQIPGGIVPDAQNVSLRSAATGFGAIVRQKNLDPAAVPALLRASKSILDTLTQAAGGVKPPNDTLREAGGLGGDLLAYALRRLRAGEVSEADRQQLAVLVGQAQNLVSISGTLLDLPPKAYTLNKQVADGNDQKYSQDVMNVIGGEGDLVKPPFSQKRERFLAP